MPFHIRALNFMVSTSTAKALPLSRGLHPRTGEVPLIMAGYPPLKLALRRVFGQPLTMVTHAFSRGA